MSIGNKVAIAVLAAALGGPTLPAFAQNQSDRMQDRPSHGTGTGPMGRDRMGGGTMSGSMMAGCAEMMQSMNSGSNGRPNSQWQKQPPRKPGNGS